MSPPFGANDARETAHMHSIRIPRGNACTLLINLLGRGRRRPFSRTPNLGGHWRTRPVVKPRLLRMASSPNFSRTAWSALSILSWAVGESALRHVSGLDKFVCANADHR